MRNLILLSLIIFISGCVAHEGQQPAPSATTEAPASVIEEDKIRKPKRISNFKPSDGLINEIKLLSRPRQAAKSLRLNKKTVKLDKHVSGFYLNREFKPAWLTSSGFGNKISNELIEILNESDLEGLNPEDYYINEIYT